jgi:hypothetical protein
MANISTSFGEGLPLCHPLAVSLYIMLATRSLAVTIVTSEKPYDNIYYIVYSGIILNLSCLRLLSDCMQPYGLEYSILYVLMRVT